MKTICLFLFLAAAVLGDVDLVLYEHKNFGGDEMAIKLVAECVDLVPEFNDRTSSVNTHGGCAVLCQDSGCKGKCVRIEPKVDGMEDLSKIGMDEVVSSVKACFPDINIILYTDANYKGAEFDAVLRGTECYNVPVDFNDKVSSLHSNGPCVRLFKVKDCLGGSEDVKEGPSRLGIVGGDLSSMQRC